MSPGWPWASWKSCTHSRLWLSWSYRIWPSPGQGRKQARLEVSGPPEWTSSTAGGEPGLQNPLPHTHTLEGCGEERGELWREL